MREPEPIRRAEPSVAYSPPPRPQARPLAVPRGGRALRAALATAAILAAALAYLALLKYGAAQLTTPPASAPEALEAQETAAPTGELSLRPDAPQAPSLPSGQGWGAADELVPMGAGAPRSEAAPARQALRSLATLGDRAPERTGAAWVDPGASCPLRKVDVRDQLRNAQSVEALRTRAQAGDVSASLRNAAEVEALRTRAGAGDVRAGLSNAAAIEALRTSSSLDPLSVSGNAGAVQSLRTDAKASCASCAGSR